MAPVLIIFQGICDFLNKYCKLLTNHFTAYLFNFFGSCDTCAIHSNYTQHLYINTWG